MAQVGMAFAAVNSPPLVLHGPTLQRWDVAPAPLKVASPGSHTATALTATGLLLAAHHRASRRTAKGCRRSRRVTRLATAEAVQEAKAKFLSLLEEKGRDCSDKDVLAELDSLAELNPTKDPACTGAFLDADWRQVSKSTFPGEVREETYTLGRLSFNLYEPKDMEWKIEQTLNPVREIKGEGEEREYEFWIDLTCVDSRYPPFKAVMKNFGMCKPDAKKPERLEVWFTGGSLAPAPDMDPSLLPEWKETFGAAIGAKKPTIMSRLGDWAMKMMMGLKKPKSVNDDGSMEFEMAKAPHGYTDILFMDDELRITKGNRGTVVVVDRPAGK